MKPSEHLRAAADLIEPDGAWTQGCPARTIAGRPAIPYAEEAVCWCATGAIRAAVHKHNPKITTEGNWLLKASGLFEIDDFEKWNDHPTRTQAEVVAMMRKAADMAEEAGE